MIEIESFIDEIAVALKPSPSDLRGEMFGDPQLASERSHCRPLPEPSHTLSSPPPGRLRKLPLIIP